MKKNICLLFHALIRMYKSLHHYYIYGTDPLRKSDIDMTFFLGGVCGHDIALLQKAGNRKQGPRGSQILGKFSENGFFF